MEGQIHLDGDDLSLKINNIDLCNTSIPIIPIFYLGRLFFKNSTVYIKLNFSIKRFLLFVCLRVDKQKIKVYPNFKPFKRLKKIKFESESLRGNLIYKSRFNHILDFSNNNKVVIKIDKNYRDKKGTQIGLIKAGNEDYLKLGFAIWFAAMIDEYNEGTFFL